MRYLNEIRFAVAIVIGLIAAVWDVKYRKIPNWLTFPAMIAGVLLNELGNYHDWSFPLLGLAVGFLLLVIPHLCGGIGAGDVKLLMALGAVLGPKGVFGTTIYGAVAGGLLSFGLLARCYGLNRAWYRLFLLIQAVWNPGCRQQLRQQATGAKLYIPYGIAITAGLFYYVLSGPR